MKLPSTRPVEVLDLPGVLEAVERGEIRWIHVSRHLSDWGSAVPKTVLQPIIGALLNRWVNDVAKIAETRGRSLEPGQDAEKFVVHFAGISPIWTVVPRSELVSRARASVEPYRTKDPVKTLLSFPNQNQIRVGYCFCGTAEAYGPEDDIGDAPSWRLWLNPNTEPHLQILTSELSSRGVVPNAAARAWSFITAVCGACRWECETCGSKLPTRWHDGDLILAAISRECVVCGSAKLTAVQPPKPNRADLKKFRESFTLSTLAAKR